MLDLAHLRRLQGFTLAQLAGWAQVSIGFVAQVERGERRLPLERWALLEPYLTLGPREPHDEVVWVLYIGGPVVDASGEVGVFRDLRRAEQCSAAFAAFGLPEPQAWPYWRSSVAESVGDPEKGHYVLDGGAAGARSFDQAARYHEALALALRSEGERDGG